MKQQDLEDEDRITAKGFINFAREYFDAYKIIQTNSPKILEYIHVKYYLLLHAFELVFKSELRFYSYSVKKIKYEFGHNLEKFLTELNSKHELLLDKKSMMMLIQVNQYYKSKQFEYPYIGYKELPPIVDLEGIVRLYIQRMIFHINNPKLYK
jgi:hypothetical protein